MTKEQKKAHIEDLFQQMYKATDAEQIMNLMHQVSRDVNSAGYDPIHQSVIPMLVKIGGDDIVERLISDIGKQMDAKDKQMVSYQMGQIRNAIDSSNLPDEEDEEEDDRPEGGYPPVGGGRGPSRNSIR